MPVSMTRLTALFRNSSDWKASSGALLTSTAEPCFHRKRWPTMCGCSVCTNKPTRQIGNPHPRRRSHSSLNASGVSDAGRAPATSQSTIAFVSQLAIPPHADYAQHRRLSATMLGCGIGRLDFNNLCSMSPAPQIGSFGALKHESSHIRQSSVSLFCRRGGADDREDDVAGVDYCISDGQGQRRISLSGGCKAIAG